ncbi:MULTISPECIES: flagellar hook assembly protein FlgD [Leeia]|uniref:Basal-body rod modification protein FlgD n=1 Tax=Leeia aquatica TaxID=2725557 RepID=A0A847SIU2_9NEIS|nr:flagellar hook assembly protein FlgD [Leeia aquatica]NLR75812.1 flagellar hook assembly protein FlgD [Leeia aquatica]
MATVGTVDGSNNNPFAEFNNSVQASKKGSAGIEDRFLKLLVTQLRNQDPLNPLDNAATTSQMAQISTVTGIEKLNTAISNMAASFAAAQSFQAATLVGRSVLTDGNTLNLASGKANAGMELAQDADKVKVTIKDKNGNVMQEVNLGAQKAGVINFSWDGAKDGGGTAADGEYKFEIEATVAGKKVETAALTVGKIESVTFGANGIMAKVTGVGQIGLGDIRQIM